MSTQMHLALWNHYDNHYHYDHYENSNAKKCPIFGPRCPPRMSCTLQMGFPGLTWDSRKAVAVGSPHWGRFQLPSGTPQTIDVCKCQEFLGRGQKLQESARINGHFTWWQWLETRIEGRNWMVQEMKSPKSISEVMAINSQVAAVGTTMREFARSMWGFNELKCKFGAMAPFCKLHITWHDQRHCSSGVTVRGNQA